MRKDISLLLLELGENAVDAHASLVEIYVQKLEKGFALTVLDDGDGMSEKTLEKAAEKGYSEKGGEGIGLYLVKTSCTSFEISSKEGVGTRVALTADMPLGDVAGSVAVISSAARVKAEIAVGEEKLSYDTEAPYGTPRKIAEAKKIINNFLSRIRSML